jgi:hypothetical protein
MTFKSWACLLLASAAAGGCSEANENDSHGAAGVGGDGGDGGTGGQGGMNTPRPPPSILTQGRVRPYALAVHDGRVIWSEGLTYAYGAIMSCEADGCVHGPHEIAATRTGPADLVVGDAIYWSDTWDGGIESCPLGRTCDAPSDVVFDGTVGSIALHDDAIFFTHGSGEYGAIYRCPLDTVCSPFDPEVVPFADDQPEPVDLVIADGWVYWTSWGTSPEYVDGAIRGCPVTGCDGAPLTLADGQIIAGAIAADAERVYWRTAEPFALVSCARTGCAGEPPTVVATDLYGTGHIALDDATVYWTESGNAPNYFDGRVASCPLTGCETPTILARDQELPRKLVLDATHLYWTTRIDGSIKRLPK